MIVTNAHKKAFASCEGFPAIRLPGDIRGAARCGLQRLNVRRLLALRAGLDLEGDALAFLQRLEAFGADLRKVREQVFATRIRCNEAKALSIVEPFDDTSFHIPVSLDVYQNGDIALKPHFSAIASATEHFRRPAQS